MKFAELILRNRIVILTLAGVLVFTGLLSWFTMPREEDPRLKERVGLVTIIYPGAGPREIERLVVEAAETELAQVGEIKTLATTIRPEAAILNITLRDSLSAKADINEAWRDVIDALQRAREKFPRGVLEPELNRNLLDLEAVVLALTFKPKPVPAGINKKQTDGRLVLMEAARRLEKDLLRIPFVSRVTMPGDPGEQVGVDLEDDKVRELALDYASIARQLREGNRSIPAGSLRIGSSKVSVKGNSTFASLRELREFPLILNSGRVIRLGDIAAIRRTPVKPAFEIMRFNGRAAVGLGVVPRKNIDLVVYGRAVRETVGKFRAKLAADPAFKTIEITEATFQPDYVSTRLSDLSVSLLTGIIIVGLVVVLAMGFRVGLLAAGLVPLISLIALGIYAGGGGILHQISIAAFVLALGLLIDNVIVVVEGMQAYIDRGVSALDAARNTIRDFALPLATATGTTLAAFVPMFGASGTTADFTRAIPLIAMLTLSVSYLFAVLVTPSVALRVLKKGSVRDWKFLRSLGGWAGGMVYHRTGLTLAIAFSLLAAAASLFPFIGEKFFPAADRNQLVVDIRLREGTHLKTTRAAAERLEAMILADGNTTKVATFIGRSTPQFYYNLTRASRSSHVAQMIVELDSASSAAPARKRIQTMAREAVRDGIVVVRDLQQGPPVAAPVEIRVLGEDHGSVARASMMILKTLREIPGTAQVRSNLGGGLPGIKFRVGDANSLQYRLSRGAVTSVLLGRTRGIPAGTYRAREEPIPILIRSGRGEDLPAGELSRAFVGRTLTSELNVSTLSTTKLEWEPAVIHHRNRRLTVSVFSEVRAGHDAAGILKVFREKAAELKLPAGTRFEFGGESSESKEANTAIAKALPLGIALLLISLLIEFPSYKKVSLILLTIPLAMVGIAPGLFFSGRPFGFLALLGGIALVGIVVNNGILLVDAIDSKRSEGADMETSLRFAIERRLRPILLTTVTTMAGLMPLAFTSATLWPPFAWAIISGLALSTVLTIFVLPSLYKIMFAKSNPGVSRAMASVLMVGLLGGVLFAPGGDELRAQTGPGTAPVKSPAKKSNAKDMAKETFVSLADALNRAARSAAVVRAYADAKAARYTAESFARAIYYPKVGLNALYEYRDTRLGVPTPIGTLGTVSKSIPQAGLEVTQPIFDPANMLYYLPAQRRRAKAMSLSARRARRTAMAAAAFRYLDVLAIKVRLDSLREFQATLRRRRGEIRRLLLFGRVPRVDLLKLDLALDDAARGLDELERNLPVGRLALSRAIGETPDVRTRPLDGEPASGEKQFDEVLRFALANRLDYRALGLALSARQLELRGIGSEYMPSIFLRGGWIHQGGGQFNRDNWYSIALGLRMPIYQGGVRAKRIKAMEAELLSLRAGRRDAARAIRLRIRQALAAIDTRRSERTLLLKGLRKASRVTAIEHRRYRLGRGTLNDVLEAETILRDRREKSELARLEMWRAWVALELARGGTFDLKDVKSKDMKSEDVKTKGAKPQSKTGAKK